MSALDQNYTDLNSIGVIQINNPQKNKKQDSIHSISHQFLSETGNFFSRSVKASSPSQRSPSIHEEPLHIKMVSFDPLLELRHIIHREKIGNSAEDLFSFCSELSKTENRTSVNEFLGVVLFLADRNLPHIVSLVNKAHIQETKEKILHKYEGYWEEVARNIKQHALFHKLSDIQCSERAILARWPIEIANAVVLRNGSINIGIFGSIKQKMLQERNCMGPSEENIINVLQALEVSPQLSSLLSSIRKPRNENAPANDVVRITLGIPSDKPIRDSDAVKVALTGLISHLRQGEVGSCFATYLAIELLASDLEQSLNDFRELLSESRLTRTIDNQKIEFPFILRMGRDPCGNTVQVMENGRCITDEGNGCFLWECPGIQAACHAIGIYNVQEAVQNAVETLIASAKNEVETKMVFKQIVEDIQDSVPNPAALLNKALFAFEAQLQNPLQRVWENALAGMAEVTNNGRIRKLIYKSILYPIQKQFHAMGFSKTNFKTVAYEAISDALARRVKLQYDPDIHLHSTQADGMSSEGGFVLYDKGNHSDPTDWKRIDKLVAFHAFLNDIIADAFQEIMKKAPYNLMQAFMKSLKNTFQWYVLSPTFLIACLEAYSKENCKVFNLLEKVNDLDKTPWVTKTGDDSREVFRVYLERINPLKRILVTPSSPQHLLFKLIQIGRQLPESLKNRLRNHPRLTLPLITTGVHAFSLLLGHPTLIGAWNGNESTSQWAEKNVLSPGNAIADKVVSKEARILLADFVANKYLPAEERRAFLNKIEKLSDRFPIKRIRHEVVSQAKHILRRLSLKTTYLSEDVDAFVYEKILSQEDQEKLQRSAIHFADTNWAHRTHDVHFCFVVNPGTDKLEVWKVNEDGSDLRPISQLDWVIGQQWEILADEKQVPLAA